MNLVDVVENIKDVPILNSISFEDNRVILETKIKYLDGSVIMTYLYKENDKVIMSDSGNLLSSIIRLMNIDINDHVNISRTKEYISYYLYGYINMTSDGVLYIELVDDSSIKYNILRFINQLYTISYYFSLVKNKMSNHHKT